MLNDTIRSRLELLSHRQNNWDQKGSRKPSKHALYETKQFLSDIIQRLSVTDHKWIDPLFITSDEDGDIEVSWYHGKHELHMTINEVEMEYIKVWGIKIDTEMDCDTLTDNNSFIELWDWLMKG